MQELHLLDNKKMRTEGKRICNEYIPILRMKKHRAAEASSGTPVFVSTSCLEDDATERSLQFYANSDDDWASEFLHVCSIISRGDACAGLFLIYKYYAEMDDRTIAENLYIGLKRLSSVKTNAYVQVAYLAGRRYTADDKKKQPETKEN